MHIHREGVAIQARARRAQRGASLVEYALLLALISFVCIGAITYFGNSGGTSIKHSTSCITTADTATPVCP